MDRKNTSKIALESSSVENLASQIDNKSNNLGQDFKDECKDRKSTLTVNNSIQNAFACESSIRDILKRAYQDEANNLLSVKNELEITDKSLSDEFQSLGAYATCSTSNVVAASGNKMFRYAPPNAGKAAADKYYKDGYKNYYDDRKREAGISLKELQKIPKDGLPDYTKNIDKWMEKQKKEITAAYKKGKIAGTAKFVDKVRPDGEMDIKKEKAWNKAFNCKFLGENDCFLYHDTVMNASTLGNVVYGYVGADIFSDFEIHSGAGLVQMLENDKAHVPMMYFLPCFGDAPEDWEAIELGVKWNKKGFEDGK